MLSSITPLGQRGRGNSWIRTVSAFWVGALLAGGLTYGGLGLIGDLTGVSTAPEWWVLIVVTVAAILDARRVRAPGPRRQVNEDWLGRYRDWVTGLGFGWQLGTGLFTIVPLWAVWALVVAALLQGLPTAIFIGIAFAAGRAALLAFTRGVDRPDRLARLMERLAAFDRPALRMTLAAYGLLIVLGALIAS